MAWNDRTAEYSDNRSEAPPEVPDFELIRPIGRGGSQVTGTGTYTIFDEFVATHQLTLDLVVDGEPEQHFDSGMVLGGSGFASQSNGVQTHVYTSTQTQILNADGEWVTVQSSSSGDGDGTPPSEAVQKALAMLGQGASDVVAIPEEEAAEPPPGFEPIPLSPAGSDGSPKKKTDTRGKPRR